MRSDRTEYQHQYWIKNKARLSPIRKAKYQAKRDPELYNFTFNEVRRVSRKLNISQPEARKLLARKTDRGEDAAT